MPMDASPYSSSSSDSSRFSSSTSSPAKPSSPAVLSVHCLKGGSRADEWAGDLLQTGDIVEEIRIGNMILKSPFKNGKSGVQKILSTSFKQKETSIQVRVRRGSDEFVELQACIVPGDQFLGRRQYVLRAINDPNYAVGFLDRTESECLNLQASRAIRMVSALERTPLQDGYVSYPWERRLHETLSVPNSSSFYSILFLPKASDRASSHYNDLEEDTARAPMCFSGIRGSCCLHEHSDRIASHKVWECLIPVVVQISGDTASSTVNASSLSDLSNLANTSLYGFEDYHGVDIGVVRAVRMWFSPLAGEIPVEIKIKDTDTKLGFAISRTEEGFIYISSVIQGNNDVPSARSGLSNLHEQATRAHRLLVVSRISNQKVLPWMVSPTGAIRCFDTVSLSQKLSLHRHARVPMVMHLFLWDGRAKLENVGRSREGAASTGLPSDEIGLGEDDGERSEGESGESRGSDGAEMMLGRDTAGEVSFRFHDFTIKNNWV
ncbi:UNVERIFIED_CONTAM: hypothetical protein Slati_0726600 [Sesamum latifolium]|uniref:Uncharacterized protein n=1 Tax=Sesamum latifolium TaxID=2727402 RepID=A0AAW2Y5K3_9LAMI